MSNFRTKNRKKADIDKRVTLDALHTKKVKIFKEKKSNIKDEKIKLEKLDKEISELKSKFECISNDELNDGDVNQSKNKIMSELILLEEKRVILSKNIENIHNNKEENDYLLKTGHLLFKYYENIDNIAHGIKTKKKRKKKKKKNDNKTVLDFFNVNDQKNITKNESGKNVNESDKNTIYQTRENILDKYLSIVEDNHITKRDHDNDDYEHCKDCHIEKVLNQSEAILYCPSCGSSERIVIDSDKPSYKDPPREVSYFAYKRINHFNEWLAQFQAKESTDIPQVVYNKVLTELKKERLTNMAKLSPYKLREILKKLKLNKYYEHVPHMINRLNGLPAPVISRDIEEKLRMMFKEIQTPFMKHCPKDRKNFLSYSYVLHKFVQLLGLDDFLSCFPLLKSREKLHQQDQIWRKICKDLSWEFIRSL